MHPGDAVCFLNSLRKIRSGLESVRESVDERLFEEMIAELDAMESVVRRNSGNLQ